MVGKYQKERRREERERERERRERDGGEGKKIDMMGSLTISMCAQEVGGDVGR
jgi:hypothetical protein